MRFKPLTKHQVKEIRELLGLSQSELAKGLGISFRTLQGWEAGRKIDTAANLLLRHLRSCRKFRDQVHLGVSISLRNRRLREPDSSK